jgi:hypothetical protein
MQRLMCHEEPKRKTAVRGSSRGTSASCGPSYRPRRTPPSRSSSSLRRRSHIHPPLAEGLPPARRGGVEGSEARSATWRPPLGLPGGHHGSHHHGPLSGSTATAVCPLDAPGRRATDRRARRYLRKWGFTPQKPLRRAYEQDPEAVRRWLEEEYPAIHKQAKAEKAEIHWGDEMGMRSDHQAGRSYGRKGRTPVVPGTGQRFGCNVISTITNRGRLSFMMFKQRFTASVAIEFLGRLVRHVGRKVFMIWDGHPVHRSRKVKRWVAEHKDRIRMFFLPGYSPQLNPDDLLNQDVKTNAVGRERPKDQPEMMANVRSYLRSTQRRPDIVKAYFQEEHVRYAAE